MRHKCTSPSARSSQITCLCPKEETRLIFIYFKTKTFSLGALVTWFFSGNPFVLSEPRELLPLSTLCSQDSPTHSPSVACPHYDHWDYGREVVMLEQFNFWHSRVKEECYSLLSAHSKRKVCTQKYWTGAFVPPDSPGWSSVWSFLLCRDPALPSTYRARLVLTPPCSVSISMGWCNQNFAAIHGGMLLSKLMKQQFSRGCRRHFREVAVTPDKLSPHLSKCLQIPFQGGSNTYK